MKHIASFVVVFLLSLGTGFAQEEWHTFTSMKDRFSINVPAEPVVTDIVWDTEYEGKLPGRVYTVKKGASTYSVTVVDYNSLKDQQIAKGKDCTPGRDGCTANSAARRSEPNGVGYWKTDIRGALVYAAFKFLQRDVKVNYYMWNWMGQGPEVNELQLTSNVDRSRTFASILMHHNWLYIIEGTVPAGALPPQLFQQSISLMEADGTRASHGRTYFNGAELDPNEVFPFGRNAGAGPAGNAAPAGGGNATPAGRGNAAPAGGPGR